MDHGLLAYLLQVAVQPVCHFVEAHVLNGLQNEVTRYLPGPTTAEASLDEEMCL